MELSDLTDSLQKHDPERFGASLAAPADARPRLWTLYALNYELARAPLQSNEPLLAQMRLQWWVDELNADPASSQRRHELLPLLIAAWGDRLPKLAQLAPARERDCERWPFSGADDAEAYIEATSVPLMRLAVEALDGPELSEEAGEVLEAQAIGAGILSWLNALPQLTQLNLGLAHDDPATIKELARRGQDALLRVKSRRRLIPRQFAPALFRGADQFKALGLIQESGDTTHSQPSEFRRRFALGRLAVTGRWWS